MQKRLRTLAISAVAVAGLGWTVRATGDSNEADQASATSTPMGPRRVAVERSEVSEQLEVAVFHGVTRAADRTVVAFTIAGRLERRSVEVGSVVKRGQTLAKIDAKPLRNARSAAQARVEQLRVRAEQLGRDKARARRLLNAGAATDQQLEQAISGEDATLAAAAAAAADLTERKRQLAETVLRAPFDAQVSAVYVEPGQVVGSGVPVVELRGIGRQEVELSVPARVAENLSVGQRVVVGEAGSARTVGGGLIRQVGKVSAGPGRLYAVIIELESSDGLEGVAVRVELPVASHQRVSVPLSALLDPAGSQPYVFVFDQGHVERRPIKVSGLVGERVLVQSGLESGDSVVVAGLPHLLDGDEVEVEP